MKKRLLSVLLTCCMLLTLLPMAALATETTGSGETVTMLTQDNISTYISSGLTDGSYQLVENVTVDSGSLKVTGTVTLDLNGFTLTVKDPAKPTVQYYNNKGLTSESIHIGIFVYSS